MPFTRGCGSLPMVLTILVLFLVSVVHSSNVTAPSCKTKFNSTLKITVIPDPHRVRRDDRPLGAGSSNVAPRCKAKFNSTVSAVNATVPKVGRIRRADKSPGGASPGAQSPGAQSPGAQSPGAQSPGSQSPGAQWPPGTQSPGGNWPGEQSLGSSVYDAQVSDDEDWPARHGPKHGSGSGTSAQMPDSGDEDLIDYDEYVNEGIGIAPYLKLSDDEVTAALSASGHLDPGEQLASVFKDVSEFKSNGWNMEDMTPYLLKDFSSQAPFGTALKSLGLSDKARPEGKHEYTEYEHTLPYMLDGVEQKPVGQMAQFGFVTDPQDACLIISVAYSTQYWIQTKDLDRLFGSESPPLSHQSDMAFLEWKRACTKYNTNTNTLKHIFFSVVTTHETQEVVHHVYGAKMGHELESMSDLPLWDQRITVEPDTDEFLALFATVQIKGIMWMLLQHREQLGKKTIKRMCIFKDEITGVVPGNEPEERGPSIYLELEDVQSEDTQSGGVKSGVVQSGGVQSGGVKSGGVKSGDAQSARVRRADNSPGSASLESGNEESSEYSDLDLSEKSRTPPPPLQTVDLAPYIQQGALVASYMRASDEEVTADLVKKGKLQSGGRIASQFTDVSALKTSGWNALDDDLENMLQEVFEYIVPFTGALQSLGISDAPRPKGKNDGTSFEHTIPWEHNRQPMKPVGRGATFQYIIDSPDACIIMLMTYSTQRRIQQYHLAPEVVSPPLSHMSDMTFLAWKGICAKYQTDLKSLKHIFISIIMTPETQNVVASVMQSMGTPVTDREDVWNNQLHGWEQKLTFQPDSDEGRALHGTVQIKGIMWMLVQHRASLGQKAIKSISIFRGESHGHTSGPTFYIELEDVAAST